MPQFIDRLELDYSLTVMLYELAIGEYFHKFSRYLSVNVLFIDYMESELRLYNSQMNQLKANIFPTFNNVLNYYMYTTGSIMNYTLPNCNA